MNKKRILFVHHGEVPGGAPRSLYNIIQALAKNNNYEIFVACLSQEICNFFSTNTSIHTLLFPDTCKNLGKFVIGWSSLLHGKNSKKIATDILLYRASIKKQKQIIAKIQPNIIHLNSSVLFSTAQAASQLKIPVIWHIREIFQAFFLRRILARYLLFKHATHIITISEAEYKSIGKKNQQKATIIYNSVAPDFFNHENPYKPKEKILLSLGGLSWRKGALQLVKTVPYLDKDVKVVIVGNQLPRQPIKQYQKVLFALEHMLIRMSIKKYYRYFYSGRIKLLVTHIPGNRIQIITHTNHIQSYLSGCRALIAAHVFPHSARTIFEAWARKKPVIAWQGSGADDIITHGVNGLVLSSKNYSKVGKQINNLLNDDKLLEKLANNGYKSAQESFTNTTNITKIMHIYESLL